MQGLTPSKQHQGLWPDRNGRCCRGCLRYWKFLSQFVLSARFTCLKQQLQTISQSQTRSLRMWVFQSCVSEGEMVAQRTGGICPVTAEPIAPGHLPFMQATQQLLPPRWPEGKSQLLTASSCSKHISQQQDQPGRSESLRQPQAGEKQRLGISSSQSFRRGSE